MTFDDVKPLIDWLEANPGLAGFATFVISIAESLAVVGLLIPGTLVMGAIGTLIGSGVLPGIEITLWAIAGAIVGDGMSYWLGYHYHGHIREMWPFRSHPGLLKKGEAFFLKYGGMSVFMGRFIGPIRPIIPVVAGMMNMSPTRFTIANVGSAIAWAPVYMMPGIILGALSVQLAPQTGIRFLLIVIAALVILWCAYYLLKWLYKFNWMLALSICVLLLGISAFYTKHYWLPAAPIPPTTLDAKAWWALEKQPAHLYRKNHIGHPIELLNVQWAGDLNTIQTALISQGWEVVPKPDFVTIINRLAAKNRFEQLPLFPDFYLNRKAMLIMTRKVGQPERLVVLRLWDANITLQPSATPVWLGTIGYHIPWQFQLWKTSNKPVALPPAREPAADILSQALATSFTWKSISTSSADCMKYLKKATACAGNILLVQPKGP